MKKENMINIPNRISKNIDITEEKARLDASCKKLLSFKIFLAHILKNCIDEFKNFDPEEIADKYIEGEPKISEITVHQDEDIKGINTEVRLYQKKLSDMIFFFMLLYLYWGKL